jgi:hypothetical protein
VRGSSQLTQNHLIATVSNVCTNFESVREAVDELIDDNTRGARGVWGGEGRKWHCCYTCGCAKRHFVPGWGRLVHAVREFSWTRVQLQVTCNAGSVLLCWSTCAVVELWCSNSCEVDVWAHSKGRGISSDGFVSAVGCGKRVHGCMDCHAITVNV